MKTNFNLLFYIRKQKNYKGGAMPIYMRITVNGKRVDMSAGRECEPAKWNNRAGRVIGTKEYVKSLNNYLDSLQGVYYGDVDHPVPGQIDHWVS